MIWNLQSTVNSIPFHFWWQERFEHFQTFHHCLFVSFILPSSVLRPFELHQKVTRKGSVNDLLCFETAGKNIQFVLFTVSPVCLSLSFWYCTVLFLAHTMMEFLEVLGEERVNERQRVCLTSVFLCVCLSSSVFTMTSP